MELIELLAGLAKLHLGKKEKAELAEQIEEIIRYVSRVKSFKTGKVKPTFHTNKKSSVLRVDEKKNDRVLGQKLALRNAHHKVDGYFKVPAVLD